MIMAAPGRVELPTSCFVGRRSIQLSYGTGTFFDYNIIFLERRSLGRSGSRARRDTRGFPHSPAPASGRHLVYDAYTIRIPFPSNEPPHSNKFLKYQAVYKRHIDNYTILCYPRPCF